MKTRSVLPPPGLGHGTRRGPTRSFEVCHFLDAGHFYPLDHTSPCPLSTCLTTATRWLCCCLLVWVCFDIFFGRTIDVGLCFPAKVYTLHACLVSVFLYLSLSFSLFLIFYFLLSVSVSVILSFCVYQFLSSHCLCTYLCHCFSVSITLYLCQFLSCQLLPLSVSLTLFLCL